jgi:hypothetical protein
MPLSPPGPQTRFFSAVLAPCDRCPQASACEARREACAAFELFLAGGAERRWRAAPRAPTRARFDHLLAGERAA